MPGWQSAQAVNVRRASFDANSMARIDGRIANLQSRIRNRIDRDSDPQANAISPFAITE